MKIKYTVKCLIDNKSDIVSFTLDIKHIESLNDFDYSIFELADEAYKEKIGLKCTCINEGQSFCECGAVIDDCEILNRELSEKK